MMTPSSPLLGVARRTNLLNVLPCATSLSQTTLFPLKVNHTTTIRIWLPHPEFPRTPNIVEGFHRGFKTRVNRPKPSVQEYLRAIKEQQVVTDYHLDRLAVGKTPSKKKRISSSILYDLCSFYTTYPTKIEYLFAVAKYFGNNIE